MQSTRTIIGQKIVSATSSLNCFSLELADGSGLVAKTAGDAGKPQIAVDVLAATALPREADAVCKVDWGWIVGSEISQVHLGENAIKFTLTPAGPLSITVQVWQGSPFLAFQPFRAPQ